MFAESVQVKRIGKLCKAEGVVDFFLACADNSLESRLTPSKRSRMAASYVSNTHMPMIYTLRVIIIIPNVSTACKQIIS